MHTQRVAEPATRCVSEGVRLLMLCERLAFRRSPDDSAWYRTLLGGTPRCARPSLARRVIEASPSTHKRHRGRDPRWRCGFPDVASGWVCRRKRGLVEMGRVIGSHVLANGATFARRWASGYVVRGCRKTSEVFRDFGSLIPCSEAGSGPPRSGERGYGGYRSTAGAETRLVLSFFPWPAALASCCGRPVSRASKAVWRSWSSTRLAAVSSFAFFTT